MLLAILAILSVFDMSDAILAAGSFLLEDIKSKVEARTTSTSRICKSLIFMR